MAEDQVSHGLQRLMIRYAFDNLDSVPLQFANHFTVQRHNDEIQFVVGQVALPITLPGLPEDDNPQVPSQVPIRILGRFLLTPTRFEEMFKLLERTRDQLHGQQVASNSEEGAEEQL